MPSEFTGEEAFVQDIKYYDGLFEVFDSQRSSYISHWTALRDFVKPSRGRFNEDDETTRGRRKDLNIYNNAPVYYSEVMASGLTAGIITKGRPWFILTTNDIALMENKDVKNWLFKAEAIVRSVLASSNFYQEVFSVFQDLVVFGTSAMSIFSHPVEKIRFSTFTCGEYFLACDTSDGIVNTFAREWRMTPAQAVSEYGYDNVSLEVQEAYGHASKQKNNVLIRHVIEPNIDYKEGVVSSDQMKWKSVHYEYSRTGSRSGEKFLKVSGFNGFPIVAPRWGVCSSDIYATACPGMLCLGDAKELQAQQHVKQDAIVRSVKPPLVAPLEMRSAKISNTPGGVTYGFNVGATQGIRALYETHIPLREMNEDAYATETRLRQGFMVDLFTSLLGNSRPQDMKSGVAQLIDNERMFVLTPVLERLHNELLNPLIKRVMEILDDQGMFPSPPEAIRQSGQLKVEYTSVLAQIQQSVGVGGIERFSGLIGHLASLRPDVIDKINLDEAVSQVGNMLNVPPDIINDANKVDQIRTKRDEEARQQQEAANVPAAAQSVKSLTEARVAQGQEESLRLPQ